MNIKIESAKDSGRSFGEPKVTVYEAVVLVDGATQVVDCFNKRVLDFIGKDAPEGTTITPNKNPQYHPKLNLPKEGGDYKPIFGGKRPFTPSYKDSKEAVILSAKTMVLSYIKDLSIKNAEISGIPITIDSVKKTFSELIPILDLDKLPETPKTAPQEAIGQVPPPIYPPLKPGLVAILKQKFRGWTNMDIIKFGGGIGLIIPNDKNTGDIFWDRLIEEEANMLINEMEKV